MAGVDIVSHVAGLTRAFNAFVTKVGTDYAQLKGIVQQLVNAHNQLDKAMENLAARQAAVEQGVRQIAGIVANGGAGAVPSVTQVPAAATVNGQAAPVAAQPMPTVAGVPSASGAPMSELSEEDAQIMFSGGEEGP